MDGAMQAIRPYQRRSAYQPTDSIAYLHPQELRCVRSEADELGPEVHLCSLCTEIALGEPLLDENEEQTEYCIAFYELPCGHLRCCSCALKWLDPAGIFYHICHFCDSQAISIDPDLSIVLDDIDTGEEPDMSWIKGFYKDKRKKSKPPPAWSEIKLPPVPEAKLVDLASSPPETPVKKRLREQRRMPMPSSIEVFGCTAPPRLQWTPTAQREEEVLEYMHDAVFDQPWSDDENNNYLLSVKVQKKHKIWSWANTPEKPVPHQAFDDWVEEEERLPRKRMKHVL